jgi:hypothetical protein
MYISVSVCAPRKRFRTSESKDHTMGRGMRLEIRKKEAGNSSIKFSNYKNNG